MNEQAKYLPADERRSATVEAVVDLAAQQNPSDITTTAIAQHMGISPETVKVHRRNLYHKLNVNGHGELFALVLRPR